MDRSLNAAEICELGVVWCGNGIDCYFVAGLNAADMAPAHRLHQLSIGQWRFLVFYPATLCNRQFCLSVPSGRHTRQPCRCIIKLSYCLVAPLFLFYRTERRDDFPVLNTGCDVQ